MTADDAVRIALVIEGTAFAIALIAWLGVAALGRRGRERARRDDERARSVLRDLLASDSPQVAGVTRLQNVPREATVRAVAEFAESLTGERARRIADIAATAGLTSWARRELESPAWWRRLRAARFLAAIGAAEERIVPLLRDPDPRVRAAAVEWAAAAPAPERIPPLIGLLAETRANDHFAVMDAIVRAGAAAVDPLARWFEGRVGAEAIPGLRVARCVPDARLVPPAQRLAVDADARVRAAAVAVLGAVGGAESLDALRVAARDPDDAVRGEAARGFGRLRHWPAGGTLVSLLRDRAWNVRREAALALRALGAPGEILLRRAFNDEDRFAADIARHILDWPARGATGTIRR